MDNYLKLKGGVTLGPLAVVVFSSPHLGTHSCYSFTQQNAAPSICFLMVHAFVYGLQVEMYYHIVASLQIAVLDKVLIGRYFRSC